MAPSFDDIRPTAPAADAIIEAIRTVASGKDFLPPHVARRLAERNAVVGLSNLEVEVLRLIAKGRTNKQIVAELALSADTVKSHITHLMRKLGAADCGCSDTHRCASRQTP